MQRHPTCALTPFKFLLHPSASARPRRHYTNSTAIRLHEPLHPSPPLETETFGRLSPWAASNLQSHSLTSVLVRHHEDKPFQVQTSLLAHLTKAKNIRCTEASETASETAAETAARTGEKLDLRSFEAYAGLTFLFWLFHRRLPRLREEACISARLLEDEDAVRHERDLRDAFACGMIEAWRLGAWLDCPKFQNDILRRAAEMLEVAEREELKGGAGARDGEGRVVMEWARRAFDAGEGERGRELREFAVDVAAKRVYDVGMNSLTLSPTERLNLSSCEQFAAAVFGSLGAQIGTKGVRVQHFALAYLIDET